MVSPFVSKNIMDTFDLNYNNYKTNILIDIHNKYLSHIDKEEFLEKYKTPQQYKDKNDNEKPKLIIHTRNVNEMCCAKVWKHDGPIRCKKKKFNDEFCKQHILKRNYGRFDD